MNSKLVKFDVWEKRLSVVMSGFYGKEKPEK